MSIGLKKLLKRKVSFISISFPNVFSPTSASTQARNDPTSPMLFHPRGSVYVMFVWDS